MTVTTEERPGQLTHHKEGRVGYVVFDNQRKFNAVNFDMWMAVPEVIAQFVADPEVRVIVITGAGDRAFISGADISQFDKKRTGSANDDYNKAVDGGYSAVLDCPKPTVAKIRGICMGGGLGLALNCDIRIVADDVKIRMPAARLGLGYQYPGLKRFTEVLGPSNTADLFFQRAHFRRRRRVLHGHGQAGGARGRARCSGDGLRQPDRGKRAADGGGGQACPAGDSQGCR